MDIETFTDRDLRDTIIRDNTEKEAGFRVHEEIIDITEIINNTVVITRQNRTGIGTGNCRQLEERVGITGNRITTRIIKMSSDITNLIEPTKSFMIREEPRELWYKYPIFKI